MTELKVIKCNVLETRVWIEDGLCGERYVVVQHDGFEPFDYAVFNYDYAYTSNAVTLVSAEESAIKLGATRPVKRINRTFKIGKEISP